MSTQRETGAGEAPVTQALSKATSEQFNAVKHPPLWTAAGKLLDLQKRQLWVCAQEAHDVAGYRYGARYSDLRRLGFRFDRRRCENRFHNHKATTQMYEWSLVGVPGELFR